MSARGRASGCTTMASPRAGGEWAGYKYISGYINDIHARPRASASGRVGWAGYESKHCFVLRQRAAFVEREHQLGRSVSHKVGGW